MNNNPEKTNQNKIGKIFIWYITGAMVILIAALFYRYQFGSYLSKQQNIWAEFGDYMNVFVSLANLIIVSSISYFLYKNEQKRDQENTILENSKIRPILIFKDIGETWSCRNVGQGAAMNIKIAYKTNENENWQNPVKIYSLMSGEEFKITWKRFGLLKWVAVYYDINNYVYSSICENDYTNYEANINELGNIENYLRLEEAMKKNFEKNP